MKSILALVFPCAVLGAAISPKTSAVPSTPFTAGAWKVAHGSAPSFYGTAINASGGKFYINRNASTYCPEGVTNLDCSLFNGTQTILDIGDNSDIYVAPDGSLSFTQAHSAYIPENSTINGFSRKQSAAFGAPIYLYNAGKNWYLCPVTDGAPTERTYQVFLAQGSLEGCVTTEVRTYTPNAGSVWQYD
ncbi:hypothetical protein F5Y19DRAFT_471949 [Xylariaceae sp. FL1651]|nr:hypothetical protein F5Y19DRAFT_471949 [Xylariaceae sp. FL1651]